MKAYDPNSKPKVIGTGDMVEPNVIFLGLANVAIVVNAIWVANVYTGANVNAGANVNMAANYNVLYNPD